MPGSGRPTQRFRALILASALVAVVLAAIPSPALRTMPTLRPSVNSYEGEAAKTGFQARTTGGGLDWGGSRARAKSWDTSVFAAAADPSVSADGRYVAFVSDGFNMDPSVLDTNDATDVFLRDVVGATTVLVSRAHHGGVADGPSGRPSISADGRWIAFESAATDIIVGDLNGMQDVFLHDCATGTTIRISVSPSGPALDGPSGAPSMSADGRFIAYQTYATNLGVTDENSDADVFLYDRDSDEDGVFDEPGDTDTRLVSSSSIASPVAANKGSFAPSISPDGGYVVFESDATNFATDRARSRDIFYYERSTGEVKQVSVGMISAGDGDAFAPAVSMWGGHVVFETDARLLPVEDIDTTSDIYAWSPTDGVKFPFGVGNGPSFSPTISWDGDRVAFASDARWLSQDTTQFRDIYQFDFKTNTFSIVSVSTRGDQGTANSYTPVMSGLGNAVAFVSTAPNLVDNDTNSRNDVFLHRTESCPGERPEDGPVSSFVTNWVLPYAGNHHPILHRFNCEQIAARGL